jgi:hypothetical protein
MWPTQEEIDAMNAEIARKVVLCDKIAASRPNEPPPSLPLSEQAARTMFAVSGIPDDGKIPHVRGTYRPSMGEGNPS